MSKKRRIWALLFLAISLTGVIALSSGISNIDLTSEWRLYDFDGEENRASSSTVQEILSRLPKFPEGIWQVLSVVGLIFIPMAILIALFSPDIRRTLLKELRRAVPLVAMVVAIVYLLNRIELDNLNPTDSNLLLNPPEMPSWMTDPTTLTVFIIGLVTLTLIFTFTYILWRRSQSRSLDLIANEAQVALDRLRAGEAYKNAIIECYSRMCRVLYEHRRIVRKESMTAREFAQQLEGLGISGWNAHRLTKLFENVRYGARESRAADEREAIECLTAITQLAEKKSRMLSTSKTWKFEH